jgi:hypothetical protein
MIHKPFSVTTLFCNSSLLFTGNADGPATVRIAFGEGKGHMEFSPLPGAGGKRPSGEYKGQFRGAAGSRRNSLFTAFS